MPNVLTELRSACAAVAEQADHVRLNADAIPAYAASLASSPPPVVGEPDVHLSSGTREERAAFWLTLDAVNFGSGWFPTLRKPDGRSGYETIALGLRTHFERHGPWSATALGSLPVADVAATFGQDPDHELMELFTASLQDLGRHVADEHRGRFASVIDRAGDSAVRLVELLAGWTCFEDTSTYSGALVAFLKRAQITAADVHRAGLVTFTDLDRLTMFADNLVPHVIRLDGVLEFEAALVDRIERGELIEHGSPEEVEIRACAVHAVELITAAKPGLVAADVDQRLWLRGREARYKAVPRHRSRCTAY